MTISRARQTGIAMVIVLWVLSLMTIMAGSFALTMRRETTVVSAVKDNAVLLSFAETGIAIAQQMLFLKDGDKRWQANGTIYPIQYQDAEIRVRLLSEKGKIDINKADEGLLTKMMSATSVELQKQQELVSALLDWRDKDDLVRINGAEKKEYEEAGLVYQPANKNFQIIDELQMILGMTPSIFQELKPLITVYSGQPKVNLKVAPKEVLLAITQPDPESLDTLLQQRTQNSELQQPSSAFPNSEKLGGNIPINSNDVYTVVSQARLFGELVAGIKVTFKKTKNAKQANPFKILDWQQIHPQVSLFSDEMSQLIVAPQNEPE